MKIAHLTSIATAVTVLTACTASTDGTVGTRYVKDVLVTAQDGATIEVSGEDSPELAGTRLVIPANALTEDTRITLALQRTTTLEDLDTPAGPVAVFGPSGIEFATPAQLTLPFELPEGETTDALFMQVLEDDGTRLAVFQPDLLVNATAGVATTTIRGFTRFEHGIRGCPSDDPPPEHVDHSCPPHSECLHGHCVPSEPTPECGDGDINRDAEECDGEDFGETTCFTFGFHAGGELSCTDGCHIDTSGCSHGETVCGDGHRTGEEACDGGALGEATCASLGFAGGVLRCTGECTYDTADCIEHSAHCGNGIIDPGEECDGEHHGEATCVSLGFDDGVLHCSGECTYATHDCFHANVCGNGHREGEEQCDGTDVGDATCISLGFDDGPLHCYPELCEYDTRDCFTANVCGNGHREGDEECDGEDHGEATCVSLGYGGGHLGCFLEACELNVNECTAPSVCGNGIREGEEQCDGTALGEATCTSLGFADGVLHCSGECTYATGDCTGGCGNGIIDANEQCDGGNLGGATCISLGFDDGPLFCNAECHYNTNECMNITPCGNGVIDASSGEVCDGAHLGDASCVSLGYADGPLECSADCTHFVTSACVCCFDFAAQHCVASCTPGTQCECGPDLCGPNFCGVAP